MYTIHPNPRGPQITGYSSLHGAVDLPCGYVGKENRDPAATRSWIPTQPPSASQHGAVSERGGFIAFKSVDARYGGWRFSDIYAGRKRELLKADHPVVYDTRNSVLDVMIFCRGQAHMGIPCRVNVTRHGRLATRIELASEIIDYFMKACRGSLSSQTAMNPLRRLGAVSLDDMVLVSLTSADGNPTMFQAIVDFVPRR